jgi:hypothetical protein
MVVENVEVENIIHILVELHVILVLKVKVVQVVEHHVVGVEQVMD